MGRPEVKNNIHAEYDAEGSAAYARSSRVQTIQAELTEEALDFLKLDENSLGTNIILDLGCGSGVSTAVASNDFVFGLDVSYDMLLQAREIDLEDSMTSKLNLMHRDMALNLPFRNQSVDGIISISALQWLLVSNNKFDDPQRKLVNLFRESLRVLRVGSKAVFQFYPENRQARQMVEDCCKKAGCAGHFIESGEGKKMKLYLIFSCSNVDNIKKQAIKELKKTESKKEWIARKREKRVVGGKHVRLMSKFSGRKRSGKFA